jgi:hypothetical protein
MRTAILLLWLTGEALAQATVGLTVSPPWLSVSNSPLSITGASGGGTITVDVAGGQSANMFPATPNGSAGAVGLRQIGGADLPYPGPSSLGGVESVAAASHNWVQYIDTTGAPRLAQPDGTDVSYTAAGTSAQPTTVTSRLQDTAYLHPDFVTTVDGSTPNTINMQSALNALGTNFATLEVTPVDSLTNHNYVCTSLSWGSPAYAKVHVQKGATTSCGWPIQDWTHTVVDDNQQTINPWPSTNYASTVGPAIYTCGSGCTGQTTISSGVYTGTSATVYCVQIYVNNTSQFTWGTSVTGTTCTGNGPTNLSTSPQQLGTNGPSIAFQSTSGYSASDAWSILVTPGRTVRGFTAIGGGAASGGSPTLLSVVAPADTSIANAPYNDVLLNLSATRTFAGGGSLGNAAVLVEPPTYAASAAQTLTTASTLSIMGPPTCSGANMTCSEALGVWIKTASVLASGASVPNAIGFEVRPGRSHPAL